MESQVWDKLADPSIIKKTAENLKARNISVEIVENKEEALARLQALIPAGAEVMTGSSTTLNQIGFTDLLKSGAHPWKNLKEAIVAEKDPAKQGKLRRQSVTAEYFLGSVHAVSANGEVVVASASGSQLPAYTFSSPHVIWVVGTQKITADLDAAIKRLKEYVLPMEDQRMKDNNMGGSFIGKMVIFEKEAVPGRITLIFVEEKLGF